MEIFIAEFYHWYDGGSILMPFKSLEEAKEFVESGTKKIKKDNWRRYMPEDLRRYKFPESAIEGYSSSEILESVNIHKFVL